MTMTDRIHRANARSRRVPSLVLRTLLALFAGGILLAVLVPALHARGIALENWMAWGVLLACLALALGPELARRISRRKV
jgi:hypothetical protein